MDVEGVHILVNRYKSRTNIQRLKNFKSWMACCKVRFSCAVEVYHRKVDCKARCGQGTNERCVLRCEHADRTMHTQSNASIMAPDRDAR